MIYVFDVDGTLTPARKEMDQGFKSQFIQFFKTHQYAIVSGSDYNKIEEQVGPDILYNAEYVMACAGNSVWQKGVEIYKSQWTTPIELIERLNTILNSSDYHSKYGNHIEHRPGMINFSVVGRMANISERNEYWNWDKMYNERIDIRSIILNEFPDLDCEIGGQISIDIYPIGNNKSQVLKYIHNTIYFFGDGIMPGKNDWALAEALRYPSRSFPVDGWQMTLDKLNHLYK